MGHAGWTGLGGWFSGLLALLCPSATALTYAVRLRDLAYRYPGVPTAHRSYAVPTREGLAFRARGQRLLFPRIAAAACRRHPGSLLPIHPRTLDMSCYPAGLPERRGTGGSSARSRARMKHRHRAHRRLARIIGVAVPAAQPAEPFTSLAGHLQQITVVSGPFCLSTSHQMSSSETCPLHASGRMNAIRFCRGASCRWARVRRGCLVDGARPPYVHCSVGATPGGLHPAASYPRAPAPSTPSQCDALQGPYAPTTCTSAILCVRQNRMSQGGPHEQRNRPSSKPWAAGRIFQS